MPDTALQHLDALMQSQIALLQALQVNQASMIDRIEQLIRPVEEKVDQALILIDAQGRQIEQLHIRQEHLEVTMMLPLQRQRGEDMPHQGEP